MTGKRLNATCSRNGCRSTPGTTKCDVCPRPTTRSPGSKLGNRRILRRGGGSRDAIRSVRGQACGDCHGYSCPSFRSASHPSSVQRAGPDGGGCRPGKAASAHAQRSPTPRPGRPPAGQIAAQRPLPGAGEEAEREMVHIPRCGGRPRRRRGLRFAISDRRWRREQRPVQTHPPQRQMVQRSGESGAARALARSNVFVARCSTSRILDPGGSVGASVFGGAALLKYRRSDGSALSWRASQTYRCGPVRTPRAPATPRARRRLEQVAIAKAASE